MAETLHVPTGESKDAVYAALLPQIESTLGASKDVIANMANVAAILKTEPTPLSRLISGLPPELTRIVTKCLKKDREERYQVVKDLWLYLKALKQ